MSAHGRIVEVRWAGEDTFSEVDVLCGTLEDAKVSCLKFCKKKKLWGLDHLTWIDGARDVNGPTYYAHTSAATFRIRQ